MKVIQQELSVVKSYMKQNKLRVEKVKQDEAFTMYLFLYRGYEEQHNYFNPRIRNKVQELMIHYLFKRYRQLPHPTK
jgi:predicted helicase